MKPIYQRLCFKRRASRGETRAALEILSAAPMQMSNYQRTHHHVVRRAVKRFADNLLTVRTTEWIGVVQDWEIKICSRFMTTEVRKLLSSNRQQRRADATTHDSCGEQVA
jgi:hypothetical protein